MHPDFWHERWQMGQIGFHEGKPNADLVAGWPGLGLPPSARVLVPLCGKTHDLIWLREQGHTVVGVELSALAAEAFFGEHGLVPDVTTRGPYTVWAVPGLEIWQGDIFDLPADGAFDAIWDRAATVALPPDLRRRYAATLARAVKPGGAMLLCVFDYPQAERAGPPFAVPPEEVDALYAGAFAISRLARAADADDEKEKLRLGVSRTSTDLYRLTRAG
jgi:thiopurine S-methyltransferase